MQTLSITVEINGAVLKVENGRVFARAFGSTIRNHSMHWSWLEIEVGNLKDEVKDLLKKRGLI